MPRVKYVQNLGTIYIANQVESWANLKNCSKYIAAEMYKDLVFVNSGACLLHEKIGSEINGKDGTAPKYNTIVFLYPSAETGMVGDHLYNRLREATSEEGITFGESFRFSVVKVPGKRIELAEDLVGLQIRFIK